MQWFRCGLVLEAPRLVYHSTLGSRAIEKKKKKKKTLNKVAADAAAILFSSPGAQV